MSYIGVIVNDNAEFAFPAAHIGRLNLDQLSCGPGEGASEVTKGTGRGVAGGSGSTEDPGNTSTLGASSIVGGKIVITVPFDVSFRHLSVIAKILTVKDTTESTRIRVIPMTDLSTHSDVYTVLRLAKLFQIPLEDVGTTFMGWTEHRKWIDLRYPEYLYLIYDQIEEIADFRKFFRLKDESISIESITRAVKLPEIRGLFTNPINNTALTALNTAGISAVRTPQRTLSPSFGTTDPATLYINMLTFFRTFKFELCFEGGNVKIQNKIEELNKERLKIWETFMINPHEPFLAEYFKYTPTLMDTWDCKGIACVREPVAGETVIAPISEAMRRFNEFTYGIFDKSPNPAASGKKFPFANVAFAGGSAAKILAHDYNPKNARQSDCDIFITGATFAERSRIFAEVLDWFKTYNPGAAVKSQTYYATRGSVTTIYIMGLQRKFQIVSTNHPNMYETIARFDLNHIQWCLHNGKFYGTPEACRAMREKITRFNNIARIRAPRLIKALHCGYNILKDETIMKDSIDISSLVELDADGGQNQQLQKMIRDLHGFYYPTTDASMDIAEEKQHILCMIEKDSNASLVTDDPTFVLNNVTIGGNFENDYEGTAFTTFNPAVIMNRAQGRRIQKVLLKSKHGAIRLTSSMMTVIAIATGDGGLDMTVKTIDPAFRDFCNVLEGNVYRMFRAGGCTRHILNESGEMKFSIPRYALDAQASRGISCLRNQRGAALNVEEDLKVGDQLQCMFLTEIYMFPEDRSVNLKPLKFIKYCEYNPEEIIKAQTENDNLEKEIEILVAQTEFQADIKYEDQF